MKRCAAEIPAGLFMLICCLLYPGAAGAVEPFEHGWDTGLAVGFNLTRGNSDTILLNVNGSAAHEKRKNIWRFEIDAAEGQDKNQDDSENGDLTQRNILGTAQYKRLFAERWYAGGLISGTADEIADIDYRYSAGLPIGRYLIRNQAVQFSVEAGPSYVFEKLGGEKNDYFAPRAAERLEWTISETSKMFQSSEIVFSAEDSDDTQITAEAGIEAAINSKLSLVLKVKNIYDNLPAEDAERNDLSVLSALKLAL